MRWPPWASEQQQQQQQANDESLTASLSSTASTKASDLKKSFSSLDWTAFAEPRTLLSTAILTTAILGAARIHRRYLRRFPDATSISPWYFRKRSLLGKVTSVGDGDNFRLYHTPGGRLFGWGWLPWKKVPTAKKDLRDKTVGFSLSLHFPRSGRAVLCSPFSSPTELPA